MSKRKKNPGYVTKSFCDERTRRIEERVEAMKNDILIAIDNNVHPPMTWQAKATIIASFIGSASAVIIAFFA